MVVSSGGGTYIRNGQVVSGRSNFRLSILPEFLLKVLGVFKLFFGTMFGAVDPATRAPVGAAQRLRRDHPANNSGGGGGAMKRANIKGIKDVSTSACNPSGG